MHKPRTLFPSFPILVILAGVYHVANADTSAPDPSRIVAACVNSRECDVAGTLVLHSNGDSSVHRIPLVHGIAQAGTSGIDIKQAEIDLEADGYWMQRQKLIVDAGGSFTLPVWRTSPLRGRFAVQVPAKELPQSFSLIVESPPGKAGPAVARGTRFECSVASDGSWTCPVPATALNVVIRAKTFTPQYSWDVNLTPGATTDLGTIPLKQGASLVAWLASDTAKSLKVPATARLIRMTMAGSPTLGDRLSEPVAEAVFNRRGVIQLAPVPPGTYTLEVSAQGFAPARVDQIAVYERSETVLRPVIKLEPPLTIRLSLEPPRDPTGALWRLSVYKANPLTFKQSNVADGTVTANGAFEIPGQSPGRYTLNAKDRHGNIYANRELEIHSEADAQRTIEIARLDLRGTITAAKKPIAADLLFGGRSGAEKISAVAGEDGSFHVTLPRAGKWTVDIESKQEGIIAAVTAKIVEKQDELSIDLPDTEVSGWVTGLDGKRLGGAVVTLYTTAGVVSRRSEMDGTYRFRGVSAGAARIHASNPRTSEHSPFVEVPIAEGARRAGIELALQNMRTLKGTLISEGQPLVGARITGYGFGTGMARQERAVSGLDGGFELSFPVSASQIALIVAAPGRTLQAFSTPPTDTPVTFDVASAGGALRLHMPRGATRPGVTYNGTPIPMPELLQWARAQGDTTSSPGELLNVSNLAPGSYRFCVAIGAGDVCRDGTLPRGGVLSLGAE